jgi:hypothetical protein
MTYRFEVLTFIAAGNATSLISVAVFLNSATGERPHWIIIIAKLCFLFFVAGTALAAAAYRHLYRFGEDVERILLTLRRPGEVDDQKLQISLQTLVERSIATNPILLRSIIFFYRRYDRDYRRLTCPLQTEPSVNLGLPNLKEGTMPRKRHSAEEIVAKLRQADVLLAQGQTGADVARMLPPSFAATTTCPFHLRTGPFRGE